MNTGSIQIVLAVYAEYNRSPFIRLSEVYIHHSSFPRYDQIAVAFTAWFIRSPITKAWLNFEDADPNGTNVRKQILRIFNSSLPLAKSFLLECSAPIEGLDEIINEIDWIQFGSLEALEVSCGEIQQEFFDRLAQVPNLQSLTVLQSGPGASQSLHWPTSGFGALEELTLEEFECETLEHIIAGSEGRLANLSSLNVALIVVEDEPDVGNLCRGIVDVRWPAVTHIRIEIWIDNGEGHETGSWEDLRPLLSLPLLQSVTYTHGAGVHITAEQIATALSTWRQLRCFCVGFGDHEDSWGAVKITRHPLSILDLFAEMSPNIQEIGLTFSALVLDSQSRVDLPRLRLKTLDVTASSIAGNVEVDSYMANRIQSMNCMTWSTEDLLSSDPLDPDRILEFDDFSPETVTAWRYWYQRGQIFLRLQRKQDEQNKIDQRTPSRGRPSKSHLTTIPN